MSRSDEHLTDEPPQQRPSFPPFRWLCYTGVFFFILTVILTSVEFQNPTSLPLKSTNVATVPLFNAWTIGWNADRAANGFTNYWDAPIFFPTEGTFAFSEPQPATILVAPVCWVTGSAIAGYKAWLFLSLLLNGFLTALLLRRLGHGLFVQLAAGTAMSLLPIVHQRIDVLQLVPIWGILWFWSSLFELNRGPGPRTSIETGIAFGACFALSVHHALFLSLVLPFSVVVFARRFADRKFLGTALSSTIVAAVVVLPIIIPIQAAAEANSFSRKERTVEHQSAKFEQYLATQSNALFHFERFKSSSQRKFNVGWFRTLLAVFGMVAGLVWGERRRWVSFLAITATAAAILSLGLNLELLGWKPWLWLSEHLPGVGQVRNVFRFVWLVQMAIVLLAAEGLASILTICQKRVSTRFRKLAIATFVFIPGVILAAEILPETPQRGGTPDVARHAGWTTFIRENKTENRPIACLPFASGNSIGDFDMTVRWMLLSLEHGAPMLNGYSGFFPRSYFEVRNIVNAEFPSEAALAKFVELNVEYLVVARKYRPPEKLLAAGPDTLKLVYKDDVADIDIYRLSNP